VCTFVRDGENGGGEHYTAEVVCVTHAGMFVKGLKIYGEEVGGERPRYVLVGKQSNFPCVWNSWPSLLLSSDCAVFVNEIVQKYVAFRRPTIVRRSNSVYPAADRSLCHAKASRASLVTGPGMEKVLRWLRWRRCSAEVFR